MNPAMIIKSESMKKAFLISAVIGNVSLRYGNKYDKKALKELAHHLTYNLHIMDMDEDQYKALNMFYGIGVVNLIRASIDLFKPLLNHSQSND
jgi:hypothetical protein